MTIQKLLNKDTEQWTKEDIINYLYSLNAVEFYGWKQLMMLPKTIKQDMIQEVWLKICEIPEQTLKVLLNQSEKNLTAYIRQFIINQLMPNGPTRKLKRTLTTETPTDFSLPNKYEEDYEED